MMKAWESKNARRALQGAGLSTMAVTLAACGGSDDDAGVVEPVAPVAPANLSVAMTAAIETATGGDGDDTFTAVNSATSTTLTDLDTIVGGNGTDTLSIADSAAGIYSLPTSMTMTGVENITLAHISDAATDVITVDVTNYADVDNVSIVNAGTAINTVTVNGSANLQSVTISGGAGADIIAVTVADAGTAGTATAASTDAITSINLTGVTGAATLSSDALTSLTVKNVGGVATNTDGYTIDARTLTVSHNGGTNGGVTDAGATTVNLNIDAATTAAGTNTFAAATTLNVDVNAALTAGTIVAAAATDVNVNLDAAVTAATITTNAATTVDYTGSANAVITQTGAAAAVFTNSGTGNLTLNTAIAAGQQYVGGAGVDTVTFAATGTTASTLGAGDDVATFSAVAGTGGSVDGGAGTDTVSLTNALGVSLSANADFEADIANFEVLSLGAIGATSAAATVVSLANLDDINNVVLAGAADNTAAAAVQTISGFTSGGSFELTAALLGATNANAVTLTGSFTGSNDVMTIKASAADGFSNVSALTVAAVETINIVLDDNDGAAANVFDLNMDAANATSFVVTGDAGITFANGTQAALTSMDASGVTATGAAGAVTFTANNGIDTTVQGGAGNDTLTGGTGNDTITGNAGTDTIVGGNGNDTINGGAGADTITGGDGTDVITGGAGNDTFILTIGETSTSADTITDYAAGDIIEIEADAQVAGAGSAGTNATTDVQVAVGGKVTFAAADDTLAEKVAAIQADTTDIAANEVVFFEHAGNTYIFGENANANASDDFYVILEGVTGMTTLTESTLVAGDFTIA